MLLHGGWCERVAGRGGALTPRSGAGSLAVLILVITLIVRGRLKPRYALLWLLAALGLLIPSLFRSVIDDVAGAFEVDYAPSLLFLAIDALVLLLLLHVSVVLSDLSDRMRILLEDVAILRHERGADEDVS